MGVGKRGEEGARSRPGQEFMELEVLWECFVFSGLGCGFLKENTLELSSAQIGRGRRDLHRDGKEGKDLGVGESRD